MTAAWVGLAVVLAVGIAAVCAARLPYLREWTGAAPLQPEPDDRPGGTFLTALGEPEYLDDLTITHDHRTD